MKTINNIEISDEDLLIWELYKFSCVLCGNSAVTLHECPPKSLNPRWKDMPETRYALCNSCHTLAHERNWRKVETELKENRDRKFPEFLKRIKNG